MGTMPCPKRCCQMRFTITRAVRGLPGLAISSATSRRPLPEASTPFFVWLTNWRKPRLTIFPGCPASPPHDLNTHELLVFRNEGGPQRCIEAYTEDAVTRAAFNREHY